MKVIRSLVLTAVGFSAGVAVAEYVSHRNPSAASAPGPVATSPAAPGGTPDPRTDLEGQMMWDPNTRTYQGG